MDLKEAALKNIEHIVSISLEEARADLKRWQDAGEGYEKLERYHAGRVSALEFIEGIVKTWTEDPNVIEK